MKEHQFLLLIADLLTGRCLTQTRQLLTDAIQQSQMPSSTPSPPACRGGLFCLNLPQKDVLSLVHLLLLCLTQSVAEHVHH